MTTASPRFSQRSSGFFRQGSLVGERSITTPRTPTDARTKRRLNTLLNKSNLIPKNAPVYNEEIEAPVVTVRKEYKNRLTDVFSEYNPDKVENIPQILSKHGNNLHSIYLKVCKKYDRPSEPEYTGPTKPELEEAIEILTDNQRDAKQSQHDFQFHLEQALDAGEKLMLQQDEFEDRCHNLECMIDSARQASGEQSALQQARMQGEINSLMTENKRIGKDKVQLLQYKHDLEDRINELMGERDKDGDLILKLNEDIEKMKHKILELADELDKAHKTHGDTLESTKQRLNRQLTWMKATGEEDRRLYEEQIKNLEEEAAATIDGLNQTIDELKNELDAEKDECRKLNKHKMQLLGVRRELEEKVAMLEDEREKDGDLILKLNDDIETYKQKISELNDELHDTNASHDRYVITTKQKMDDTINTYENKIAVLREAKVEERIRLEGELDNLQEELNETKLIHEDELIKMDNAIFSAKENGKQKLSESITKYETQLAQLREKHLEERIRLESNISNLEEKNQDTTQQYEAQITKMEGDNERDLHIASKTLEHTRKKYQIQLDDLQNAKIVERMKFEAEIEVLKEEYSTMKRNYDATIKVMEDDHQTDMHIAQKTLEKTTKKFLGQLSDLQDAKAQESNKLQAEITRLIESSSDLRNRLESQIENLEAERDKDGDLILKLNDDCERFRIRVKGLENEVEALEMNLHSTKEESKITLHTTRSELKRQLTFVESTHAEKHQEHEKEKERLRYDMSSNHQHNTDKLQMANMRISELSDQLDFERTENGKKVAAYNILRKKFDNAEREMSNMMEDLIQKTNKIRELEKQVRESATDDQGDQSKRQSRLQNLKIQELELEIEKLQRTHKTQLEDLQETLRMIRRDLTQKKALLEQLTQEKAALEQLSSGSGGEMIDHLQQQLGDTRKKYEQSNETVIRLDEALRAALAKQDDFTSKITELKGEIMRLQRKTERAESFISETTVE